MPDAKPMTAGHIDDARKHPETFVADTATWLATIDARDAEIARLTRELGEARKELEFSSALDAADRGGE